MPLALKDWQREVIGAWEMAVAEFEREIIRERVNAGLARQQTLHRPRENISGVRRIRPDDELTWADPIYLSVPGAVTGPGYPAAGTGD
jgi:hypothetical protein